MHDSCELDGEKSELKKDIPAEVNTNAEKDVLDKLSFKCGASDIHHLSRMLYSCLVDADYLDTEAFMDKGSSELRANKTALKDLLPKLEAYLRNLKDRAENTEVNHIRSEVQLRCVQTAVSPIGFYSLTVPTGGGKTLSSLVWAMKHAIHNGQKRIIIAIPYTSIIVQTVAILRDIFGAENVLEHHMHSEFYQVTPEAAKLINDTKAAGGRVICVGTTSCRTIESAADQNGVVQAGCGDTEIFIYPGYQFKVLDNLITNFHLPESTLIMLVSALAGREHVLRAYETAVEMKYRFFSFGDAMFIK